MTRRSFHHFTFLTLCAALALSAGCSKKAAQPVIRDHHIAYTAFVSDLTDTASLPLLDGADIRLYSSHDRTGGNNDFNYFEKPSKDAGWMVIAELEGPGCVRRWWMTGTDPGHRVRVYIDGEKTPRIDEEIQVLFGSAAPWTPPLAQYVNMCFYSYVPIPFNETVRIETMEPNNHPYWGPRRIFFQLNVQSYDRETTSVESYPREFSTDQRAALDAAAEHLAGLINSHDVPLDDTVPSVSIASGARADIFAADGTGTLSTWNIDVRPGTGLDVTQIDREYLLQDTVLRIYYGNAQSPSVEVPLGDFFANAWRKRCYGTAWMTSGEKGYSCRLPLPYRDGVRIEIENASDHAIDVTFSATRSGEVADNAGYFHAEYRRSGPSGSQPHPITSVSGRGKFMGAFLGVTGLDDSWWILEGDESMWVDGSTRPVWQGTGLEDYFNGGWYYRGSVLGAFNGNFDRASFRVAQFRHQHPDPVSFDSSFSMQFERMRNERNGQPVNGYFQSVAYMYLESPQAVQAVPARAERRAVANPNDQKLTMLQLVELERMNDFGSAVRLIDEYVERWPDAEDAGVYRLRQLEYRRLLGDAIDETDYASFVNGDHGEEAAKQAKILQWFYESPNRALIGLNANAKSTLLLDGKPLMSGDHPYYLYVMGAELPAGPHQLAIESEFQRGDPWVQVGVRMGDNLAGTGPGTWNKRNVDSGWATADASAPSWYPIEIRNVPRGVPDAPYIGGIANAFVLLQSKSYPIAGQDWGYFRGKTYFRQDFAVPIDGWPEFSLEMTGLRK